MLINFPVFFFQLLRKLHYGCIFVLHFCTVIYLKCIIVKNRLHELPFFKFITSVENVHKKKKSILDEL